MKIKSVFFISVLALGLTQTSSASAAMRQQQNQLQTYECTVGVTRTIENQSSGDVYHSYYYIVDPIQGNTQPIGWTDTPVNTQNVDAVLTQAANRVFPLFCRFDNDLIGVECQRLQYHSSGVGPNLSGSYDCN